MGSFLRTFSLNLLGGDQSVVFYDRTNSASLFTFFKVGEMSKFAKIKGIEDPKVFSTRFEWGRCLVFHSFRVGKIHVVLNSVCSGNLC